MLFRKKENLNERELQKRKIDEKIQSKDLRNDSSFSKKKNPTLEKIIKWRYIIFNTLFSITYSRSKKDMIFSFLYIALISLFSFVCVVPLVTTTQDPLRTSFLPFYYFLVIIFTFDWLFRLSFIDIVIKKSEKKFKKFIMHQFSFLAIIDFLTWILPFIFLIDKNSSGVENYIPMILIVKSLTAFRLLYLFNKTVNIQTLLAVVKKSIKQLLIVISIMLVFVFLFSLILYNVEVNTIHVNSKIKNWFDAFWMCFITITTIGYGDVVPTTDLGKVLTMILAITGISFYSFLTSIIVNGFSKYLDELRRKREIKNLENSKNMLKQYKTEIDTKLKKLDMIENKEENELRTLSKKIFDNKISTDSKLDNSKKKTTLKKKTTVKSEKKRTVKSEKKTLGNLEKKVTKAKIKSRK